MGASCGAGIVVSSVAMSEEVNHVKVSVASNFVRVLPYNVSGIQSALCVTKTCRMPSHMSRGCDLFISVERFGTPFGVAAASG